MVQVQGMTGIGIIRYAGLSKHGKAKGKPVYGVEMKQQSVDRTNASLFPPFKPCHRNTVRNDLSLVLSHDYSFAVSCMCMHLCAQPTCRASLAASSTSHVQKTEVYWLNPPSSRQPQQHQPHTHPYQNPHQDWLHQNSLSCSNPK